MLVGSYIGFEDGWLLVPGAASVLGHLYPVFLKFKGGGGLATLIGIGVYLMPPGGVFLGVVLGAPMLAVTHNTVWSSGVGILSAIIVAIYLGTGVVIVSGILGLALGMLIRVHSLQFLANRRNRAA